MKRKGEWWRGICESPFLNRDLRIPTRASACDWDSMTTSRTVLLTLVTVAELGRCGAASSPPNLARCSGVQQAGGILNAPPAPQNQPQTLEAAPLLQHGCRGSPARLRVHLCDGNQRGHVGWRPPTPRMARRVPPAAGLMAAVTVKPSEVRHGRACIFLHK